MKHFVAGQTVLIPCDISQGAFPTEMLVTFETKEGPVSGFVRSTEVEKRSADEGLIRGVVKEVSNDIVSVIVHGSFFTTTGLAYLRREWANSHVEPAYA